MKIQTRLLKLEKKLITVTNNIPPIVILDDGETKEQAYKRLGVNERDNAVVSFICFE